MIVEKSAADILLEAAELLQQSNRWHKGSYFVSTSDGCAMCAHGAIAYCAYSDIRTNIAAGNFVTAREQAGSHAARLVRDLAFRVGLSYGYNDCPTTSLQDVVNKLHEAAQLASQPQTTGHK